MQQSLKEWPGEGIRLKNNIMVPFVSGKKSTTEDKEVVALLIIFTISLILRIFKLVLDPVPMRDSTFYLSLAREWLDNGMILNTDFHGPLLPIYTIKELARFTDIDIEIAGRSLALFLGSMIPALGYFISYKIFDDRKISVICAIILMLHPNLISYSIEPLRDSPYLFFEELIILEAIIAIKERKTLNWFFCGIFSTLAFFCRLEALEYLLIIPLVIFYLYLKNYFSLRKFALNISTYIIPAFLSFITIPCIIDLRMDFVFRILFYAKDRI